MDEVARPAWREIVTAVAVATAVTLVWVAVLPLAEPGADALEYLQMAANPKAVGHTPYAFRGLTPWLAYEIGGTAHHRLAFRLITGASLAAAGPAAYLICRRLGGTHLAALVGMVGVLSLPQWLFNLHQPYLIDGPALALTAWSLVALVYGWLLALPLLLVAAGLARENVVGLALPIYMWLRRRWVDLGAAWQVILVMAPALITAWAIRQPMVTRGWQTTWLLAKAGWKMMYAKDLATDPVWWACYAFVGSLGVWWVLGLYGWRHGGRLWWLLVPVFAQFAVGGDWSRFALYAFPVVVPAGAIALWHHPRRPMLLGLVAVQSLAALADVAVNGRLVINAAQPSTYVTAGLMVLTAVVVWVPARPRGRPRLPLPRRPGSRGRDAAGSEDLPEAAAPTRR